MEAIIYYSNSSNINVFCILSELLMAKMNQPIRVERTGTQMQDISNSTELKKIRKLKKKNFFQVIKCRLALFLSFRDVKPIEHQLRPKGLGLGADRSSIKDLEPSRPRRPPKPGEQKENDDEGLVLGPGGCVLIQTGAHKDLYGKVRLTNINGNKVMLQLFGVKFIFILFGLFLNAQSVCNVSYRCKCGY